MGGNIHAEAVRSYQQRGLLSQKDLMNRWGVSSARTVQRYRTEFNLRPCDFWGINPLFSMEEILRVERLRNKKRTAMLNAKAARCGHGKIISVKQVRARAGKRGRK